MLINPQKSCVTPAGYSKDVALVIRHRCENWMCKNLRDSLENRNYSITVETDL